MASACRTTRVALFLAALAFAIVPGVSWSQAPQFNPIILNAPDGHNFGAPVAFVGDIDGDGTADFAVGELGGSRVYIFSGSDQSLLRTLNGECSGYLDLGGLSVAGFQDVDYDGVPEIVVACHSTGLVYLFSGGVDVPGGQALWVKPSPGGYGVAAIPDSNGDGVQDILVGSCGISGACSGLGGQSVVLSGATGEVIRPIGPFGTGSIFGVGDINDDGVSDYYLGV